MAGDFYLYVGTDILIRALSERYLEPKDQMTRNVLRMAAEVGATLVLAEPVLNEVLGNLRASDTEYEINFRPLGNLSFREAESMSPRILVRTYYHALANEDLGGARPKTWGAFVNQFVDYATLGRPAAATQLRRYLVNEFNMVFESASDLEKVVDQTQLMDLTKELVEVKEGKAGSQQRARADALMVLGVYGRRDALAEHARTTEFGLRTWWLTGEAKILGKTKKLVKEHSDERFIMRPEFLLNFLALAPSAAAVRTTYENIFPTVLGVKLSRRMDENAFHALMDKVREADEVDEGRKKAQIADNADKLKGDFLKDYYRRFTDG
jgi:hypothetical protein